MSERSGGTDLLHSRIVTTGLLLSTVLQMAEEELTGLEAAGVLTEARHLPADHPDSIMVASIAQVRGGLPRNAPRRSAHLVRPQRIVEEAEKLMVGRKLTWTLHLILQPDNPNAFVMPVRGLHPAPCVLLGHAAARSERAHRRLQRPARHAAA